MPYRRRYRTAVADAFNVYLNITRRVDQQVKIALARDTENWRVLNACPACSYTLEGEPPLRWSRMFCLDGNNSLKRIAPTAKHQQGDMRVLDDSDYFLSRDYVDRFANEVSSRTSAASQDVAGDMEPDDDVYEDAEGGGDPADAVPPSSSLASCTRNWKAASAEEKKKMWAVFDETGIFASACPHGLILWIADMVRSGELYVIFCCTGYS